MNPALYLPPNLPPDLPALNRSGSAIKRDAPASSSAASNAATGAPSAPVGGTALLASQTVFLQLLVAQLKNQDPQNPTDGTQFVTQLAQFTTLDQTTQGTTDLNQILSLLRAGQTPTSASSPAAAASATPSTVSVDAPTGAPTTTGAPDTGVADRAGALNVGSAATSGPLPSILRQALLNAI